MKYGTIVADPPWPITWSGGRRKAGKSSGSTKTHDKKPLPYSTMDLAAIVALPVGSLAADDSLLFLWTVDRYVMDGSAATVVRAWGFYPLPHLLIWSKRNPGLGTELAPAHEPVMVGRRGSARLARRVPTVNEWRQPYENGAKLHSAKPDGAFDLFLEVGPGPHLELFARRQRLGWDSWGNECRCDVSLGGDAGNGT